MTKKTIFVIPGFRQSPKNKAYKEIAKILKSHGYYPIVVEIPWRKTSILKNSEYFVKKYKNVKRKDKYILGFSFGAMIALIAATKLETNGLILCSLSPYFKEDVPTSKLYSKTLAKKVKVKQVLMLYGTHEARSLKRRVTQTFDHISSKEKQLIQIRKTEHNIGDRRYLHTINQAVQHLY